MVYVDLNSWRARLIDKVKESAYCSLRHHIGHDAGEEDLVLVSRLTKLGSCMPVDSYTGELNRSRIHTDEYRSLIAAASGCRMANAGRDKADRVLSALGLEPSIWENRMQKSGLFQSGAVGNSVSRGHYAESNGKSGLPTKRSCGR